MYQFNMLYTLNFHNVLYSLYLNKNIINLWGEKR